MLAKLLVDGFPVRVFIFGVLFGLPGFVFPAQAATADDKASENPANMIEFVRDNPSCIDFTVDARFARLRMAISSAPRRAFNARLKR
ncbi:hypothetical protein [Agrobacterium tumefaciens]|uniref:hypothetical protein n=1 Tax=Agrobacterium tumefaciens TaxID=358 RepID=UPI001F359A04